VTIARKHPIANWLYLPSHEQIAALDKVIAFRDKSVNPLEPGLPAEAIEWFWETELPRLAKRPEVRQQALARCNEITAELTHLEGQLAELSPMWSGNVQNYHLLIHRRQALQAEVDRIQTALKVADNDK
jgi:hypothetical protein